MVTALDLSCNETLPTHTDPRDLFRTTRTAYFYAPKNELPQLWISLMVRTGFDETLQDTTDLQGSIGISLGRDTRYHKTVALDLSNLITTNVYDPKTHLLTINSGDTLVFLYRWDFHDDDGTFLPTSVFIMQQDTLCPFRMAASAEILNIDGSMRLYRRTAIVASPPLRYVLNYVLGTC